MTKEKKIETAFVAACRDSQIAGICKAHAQLQDLRARGESPKKQRPNMPGHSDTDSRQELKQGGFHLHL